MLLFASPEVVAMQTAEKISITVTPEMLRTIPESVDAGEYASTGEVIRHAMRLWQRERDEHAECVAGIKVRIRKSVDDPRPALTSEETREAMEAFMAEASATFDNASSQGRVSARGSQRS